MKTTNNNASSYTMQTKDPELNGCVTTMGYVSPSLSFPQPKVLPPAKTTTEQMCVAARSRVTYAIEANAAYAQKQMAREYKAIRVANSKCEVAHYVRTMVARENTMDHVIRRAWENDANTSLYYGEQAERDCNLLRDVAIKVAIVAAIVVGMTLWNNVVR